IEQSHLGVVANFLTIVYEWHVVNGETQHRERHHKTAKTGEFGSLVGIDIVVGEVHQASRLAVFGIVVQIEASRFQGGYVFGLAKIGQRIAKSPAVIVVESTHV